MNSLQGAIASLDRCVDGAGIRVYGINVDNWVGQSTNNLFNYGTRSRNVGITFGRNDEHFWNVSAIAIFMDGVSTCSNMRIS